MSTVTIMYLGQGCVMRPYCPAYSGISRDLACALLPRLKAMFPRDRLSIQDDPPPAPAGKMKWRTIMHLGGAR